MVFRALHLPYKLRVCWLWGHLPPRHNSCSANAPPERVVGLSCELGPHMVTAADGQSPAFTGLPATSQCHHRLRRRQRLTVFARPLLPR